LAIVPSAFRAGAIGASAAVINAITDAIANNKLEMPATPDRLWHAIHGKAQ
jgi:carbon-monoxide dehydrogenase large subunit